MGVACDKYPYLSLSPIAPSQIYGITLCDMPHFFLVPLIKKIYIHE
jgi:hypothetical protein